MHADCIRGKVLTSLGLEGYVSPGAAQWACGNDAAHSRVRCIIEWRVGLGVGEACVQAGPQTENHPLLQFICNNGLRL